VPCTRVGINEHAFRLRAKRGSSPERSDRAMDMQTQ
jgi:hypothetical protein